MYASNVSLSSYCKIQNWYFLRSTTDRKIPFRSSGKQVWSFNCLYGLGRTIQLRTESKVFCNFAEPCLLNELTIANYVLLVRTWFLFFHTVVVDLITKVYLAVVIGAQCDRLLRMKSVIRIFLYLLEFEFCSDTIAFSSIGQISMGVEELHFHHF